jgi:hypothetical protein
MTRIINKLTEYELHMLSFVSTKSQIAFKYDIYLDRNQSLSLESFQTLIEFCQDDGLSNTRH